MAFQVNTPVRTQRLDADPSGEPVVISYASELMKTYKAGKAFSAGQRIAAAYDCDNNPMIFSIGDDQHLHLIMRHAGSPNGWQQIDLSVELGAQRAVQTFAVSQDKQGTLRLALALERSDAPGMSDLYISRSLSNDPNITDWHFFGQKWVARPYSEKALKITRILLGTNDDNEGTPLMLVGATPAAGDAGYWFVNTDPDVTSALWSYYPLPTNAQHVIDLAVGTHLLGRGIYALYLNNGERVLQFRQLEDAININLSVPRQATRLAVLPNDQGAADLYVAGDGVYLFKAENQMSDAHAIAIQTPDPLPSVVDMIVRDDAETVALWALTSQHELLYTTASKHDSAWSMPIRLRKDVAQIAPLRNPQKMANEMLMVGANDVTLAYLWQDPQTALWQETSITLPDSQKMLPFNAYLTQVHFRTQTERPVVDAEVTVTASSWCHAMINGIFYVLDANQSVKVRTDATGGLAITNKVESMATPRFKLQIGNAVMTFDPAQKIKDGLRQVQTGDDWLKQKTQNGQPLLKTSVDASRRQAAAEAMQQLAHASDTLQGSAANQEHEVLFKRRRVSLRAAEATQIQNASEAAQPLGMDTPRSDRVRSQVWGISFEDEQPKIITRPLVSQRLHVTNALTSEATLGLDAQSHALFAADSPAIPVFGDIWELIEQGFEHVKRFFIEVGEDLVNFVIDLGNRIVKLVITVAEEIYRAVSWLLKELLNIDLDQLIEWLGFLFNWNDILYTHTFMRSMAELSYQQFLMGMDKLKELTDEAFSKVRAYALGGELPSSKADEIFKKRINDSKSPGGANYFSLPQVSWIGNTLGQNIQAATIAPVSLAVELGGTFTRILETQGEIFQNTYKEVTDDIIAQIDTLSLGEILHKLWAVVTENVLNTAENIVLGIIEIAEVLAKAVWKFFNTRWDIPLITSLYEQHIAPGSEFTLLDLGCLLAAIPTTIVFKLITKKAPVTAAQANALKGASIKTFDDLLAPWLAPQPQPNALRMRSNSLMNLGEVSATAGKYEPTAKELALGWISGLTGIAGAVLRFYSGIVNAAQELMAAPGGGGGGVPLPPRQNPKFQLQATKLILDLISYAGSCINMTCYLAMTTIQGGLKTTRIVLDSIVVYGQGFLRLKDGFLAVWWLTRGSEFDAIGREVLSWAETVFGVIMLIISCVAIGLEANESPPKALEAKPDIWKVMLGLKGTQNILNGIYQGLAGPRTTLQRFIANPYVAPFFWATYGTRVVLTSLAIPGITLFRSAMDITNGSSSIIFAGGS